MILDAGVAWSAFLHCTNCVLVFVCKSSGCFYRCTAACDHVWRHLVNAVANTGNANLRPSLQLSFFSRDQRVCTPVFPDFAKDQPSRSGISTDIFGECFCIFGGVSWQLRGFTCKSHVSRLPCMPIFLQVMYNGDVAMKHGSKPSERT